MEIQFPKIEKKILKFWKANKIFEKSIKQRAKAQKFVFYEGPPTANGKPGIHHVLSRIYKDIICRYKTMQGYRVVRKAGWDTHGLPVELEIEKKLGLKSKKDIEEYGIAKFNKLCKQSVWAYLQDWKKLTERIAFWLDTENPYVTYENYYMETVWWIIKQIHQKGLLYQGHKVVPYCPRCGTSLSSHEVALGYENVKENSVYIKFKILSKEKKWQNSSILSWTTTPWTLPGNVALAVNPKFTYIKAKVNNEFIILAKDRIGVLEKDYQIVEELSGKDILGLEYQPLFKVPQLKTETSYRVYPADFVTMEEGTGVVHTAVMYGEDDYNLGKKFGLPTFHTVTEEGKFIKSLGDGLGSLYVKGKETEFLIIELLKNKGFLFREEQYSHDYPFCWRCHSPLLYYAKESWFIDMQKVKKDLIEENKKINWVPSYLKEGRFGEWLKEIKDWAFSRERYWGTPLPVWQCQNCRHTEVIGSKKDLIDHKFTTNNYFVLRHGESLRNIQKTVSCWPEKSPNPLTPKGKKQIKNVANKLKRKKIDLIFSSDVLRTKQTAQIVGDELKIKPKFDKSLRELDMGKLNGQPVDIAGKFWDPERKLNSLDYYLKRFKVRAPKGENYIDTQKRMYNFLKTIDRKYQNKNILIVSHEAPITILEGAVKGFSPEEIIKYRETFQIKTGELRRLNFKVLPYSQEGEVDFHRPYIDEVKFHCPKCNKLMIRVPEVIDCWFDSGSMPFAQYHYPFENKELIDLSTSSGRAEQFPADYISEAIDQTRGWFYTLHAISNLLGKGSSYKNVVSLGHVLDEKGEKMSKSKNNVVDPNLIIEKYGSDATRWYFYTVNQPGDAKFFAEKEVFEALKKFIMTFWNSFSFLETYRGKSKIAPPASRPKTKNILDKWIISKLNNLIQETTQRLNNYDVTGAARAIENFTIVDLSQWYIRRSRKRFQSVTEGILAKNKGSKRDYREALEVLNFVLLNLSKLSAPFIPFLSEHIYKKLVGANIQKSVHLEDWLKVNKKLIDSDLEKKFIKVRELVALALAERAKAGIKVRQPLTELQITNHEFKKEKDLLELILEEVNLKKITFGKNLKLETKLTSELKEEGIIREVVRNIQEMRKKARLKPKDKIQVRYSGTEDLNKIFARNKKFILREAKIKSLLLGKKPKQVFDVERELKIDGQNLRLAVRKI